MIEVQSGDVAALRDATVTDLVNDLNKKQAQIPLAILAACCFALVGALLLVNSNGQSVWVTVGSIRAFYCTTWRERLRLLTAKSRKVLTR
jgi:hypothetical protein